MSSLVIKFADKKKEFVVDFVLPNTQKDLKRFLRIATYFSDHIRNFSVITKCLRDPMLPYKPKSILVWDSDSIKEFELVNKAVSDSPTQFLFVRIFLCIYTQMPPITI